MPLESKSPQQIITSLICENKILREKLTEVKEYLTDLVQSMDQDDYE
jgi:hypothetical protein